MMYNKAFGSDNNFYRLEIDYRQYKTLGKRKVLAWTVQTKNVFGNVPLTKYALSGTPFDLRGYYMGQFRDKSSHVMMAEYRQMINTDKSNWVKKMLNHVGYVAWEDAASWALLRAKSKVYFLIWDSVYALKFSPV